MSSVGQIKKSKKNNHYTVVPNEILRSKELSWKAKGLMAYLLGMSEDWIVYKKDLGTRSLDGYDSTVKAFKELVDAGYIIEHKVKGEKGRFMGYEYEVLDTPYSSENPPARDFPEPGFPELENPQLISNSNKKELLEEDIDKSISMSGIVPMPNGPAVPKVQGKPSIESLPATKRCDLFVASFNKEKEKATGKPGKFQQTASVLKTFKVRIRTYTGTQILHCIKVAFQDKNHIENNFVYLTPDYILREYILQRYLNVEDKTKSESGDEKGMVY